MFLDTAQPQGAPATFLSRADPLCADVLPQDTPGKDHYLAHFPNDFPSIRWITQTALEILLSTKRL
jgi:hypothetical protein